MTALSFAVRFAPRTGEITITSPSVETSSVVSASMPVLSRRPRSRTSARLLPVFVSFFCMRYLRTDIITMPSVRATRCRCGCGDYASSSIHARSAGTVLRAQPFSARPERNASTSASTSRPSSSQRSSRSAARSSSASVSSSGSFAARTSRCSASSVTSQLRSPWVSRRRAWCTSRPLASARFTCAAYGAAAPRAVTSVTSPARPRRSTRPVKSATTPAPSTSTSGSPDSDFQRSQVSSSRPSQVRPRRSCSRALSRSTSASSRWSASVATPSTPVWPFRKAASARACSRFATAHLLAREAEQRRRRPERALGDAGPHRLRSDRERSELHLEGGLDRRGDLVHHLARGGPDLELTLVEAPAHVEDPGGRRHPLAQAVADLVPRARLLAAGRRSPVLVPEPGGPPLELGPHRRRLHLDRVEAPREQRPAPLEHAGREVGPVRILERDEPGGAVVLSALRVERLERAAVEAAAEPAAGVLGSLSGLGPVAGEGDGTAEDGHGARTIAPEREGVKRRRNAAPGVGSTAARQGDAASPCDSNARSTSAHDRSYSSFAAFQPGESAVERSRTSRAVVWRWRRSASSSARRSAKCGGGTS